MRRIGTNYVEHLEIMFKQRISMALAEVDVIDGLGKQTLMCISKHTPRGVPLKAIHQRRTCHPEVNCHHSR